MAYVSNMPDDQENKNPSQGAVPPSGGGGVQIAPSGGVGSAGASPTPGQPAAGGSFATLDKYISANQGQAQPLANKITSGIGKEYDTLAGQNASTLADVGSQVTAGSAPSNANAIIAQEAANPVSFAGDQGNVNQFKSLLNATYAGPASAESTPGFTAQQNAVNSAIANGKNSTTTEAGRSQLLAKNEAAPSTSVTGLNSAILSQSPEALSQVEGAYKPFQNLVTGLSTGAAGINQNISKAQSDASAANAAANKQISDQAAALTTGVNTKFSDAQKKVADYNAAVSGNQQATQAPFAAVNTYLSQLGLGSVANPLASYQNQQEFTGVPTIGSTASAEDYATAKALSALNPNLTPLPINDTTANAAGTFTGPTGTINPVDFSTLFTPWEASTFRPAEQAYQRAHFPNGSGWGPANAENMNNMGDFMKYLLSVSPDLAKAGIYANQNPGNQVNQGPSGAVGSRYNGYSY